MKVKEIYTNLFLYTFPNQYELASTFIRLQEFYESPYKEIKGKYFTLETFMDLYAKDNKDKFTYFEDWNGFNVPGDIVWEFQDLYAGDLNEKEANLLNKKDELVKDDFYIIGIVEGEVDTLSHEIAHGLYYLNKNYKREMSKLINNMPILLKQRVEKYLLNIGYCKVVLKDELQAYFATGIKEGMIHIWHHIIYQSYIQKIKKIFKNYSKDIKSC